MQFFGFTISGLKKFSINTVWLFLEKVIRLSMGFLVGIWVARYLGPEKFGVLNYGLAVMGLVMVFSNLGMDSIIVREIINQPQTSSGILASAWFMRIIGALLIIVFEIILLLNSYTVENIVLIIVSLSIVVQSFAVVDLYFQSKVKNKYFALANIFGISITSLLRVYFIISSGSLLNFAWLIPLESVIISLILIISYYKQTSNLQWKINLTQMHMLIKKSWPLMLSFLFVSIYFKIDQVMIKYFLNSNHVGLYAAAIRISEIWYFIPVNIMATLFPYIVSNRSSNNSLYILRQKQLFRLMFWISFPIAVVIAIYSDSIMYFLYGNDYVGTSKVLTYHIWATIFVFLGTAVNKILLAENLERHIMINSAIGALLNILLNVYLIPRVGILGAAIATLVSYSAQSFFLLLFWSKTRIIPVRICRSIIFQ